MEGFQNKLAKMLTVRHIKLTGSGHLFSRSMSKLHVVVKVWSDGSGVLPLRSKITASYCGCSITPQLIAGFQK